MPSQAVGWLKRQAGTPLVDTDLVDDRSLRRLRAVSIGTVEELLGLISADSDAVMRFLPDLDLPQVQADAALAASAPILAEFQRVAEAVYTMGALPPEDVEVEERASAAYVDSWLPEAEAQPDPRSDAPPEVWLDCFGPIRNQGKRGTCVAHAVSALLECQERRAGGPLLDLAEQFVYWNVKRQDGQPQQEGTWLRVAMPATSSDGACLESTWPYNPTPVAGAEGQGPPPSGAQNEARHHLLEDVRQLDPRNSAAMRDVLERGLPLAISIPVYNDWSSNAAANALGLIPMPLPNSVRTGGHCMCVTGYGWDAELPGGGYLIVRNSWGEVWAPQSPLGAGNGAVPFLYVDRYGWESWTAGLTE